MAIINVQCRLSDDLLRQSLSKIAECGNCKTHEFSDGVRAILLPSCTLLIDQYDPALWGKGIHNGPTRIAKEIRSVSKRVLDNTFWVKSPEDKLTLSKSELGDVWWDKESGPDGYNFFRVQGDILRAFARWEAAYLTKLWYENIPAEEPQAIIEYPNGISEVLVRNIPAPTWRVTWTAQDMKSVSDTYDSLKQSATSLGFVPNDFEWITDTQERRKKIIDVARWNWPPVTDEFFTEVRRLLHRAREKFSTNNHS